MLPVLHMAKFIICVNTYKISDFNNPMNYWCKKGYPHYDDHMGITFLFSVLFLRFCFTRLFRTSSCNPNSFFFKLCPLKVTGFLFLGSIFLGFYGSLIQFICKDFQTFFLFCKFICLRKGFRYNLLCFRIVYSQLGKAVVYIINSAIYIVKTAL